jgi:hypothetical protein
MKIEVVIGHTELLEMISEYVENKVGHVIDISNIHLYVKSKENFRLKTFEAAELTVTNKPMPSNPMDKDTELKADISQEVS